MKLIICVDDNNGRMFNRRRQSKDREVRHDILAYTMPERIWMNEYSLEQFETDDTSRIQVANNFLIQADDNDYCFIENGQYLIDESRLDEIVLYHWNRVYPADYYFDIDLHGWTLADQKEFKGFSHDKITREIWTR